jgi:hypothetical protein
LKKDFGRDLREILIQDSPQWQKSWFKKVAYAIRSLRFGGMLGTFSTASVSSGNPRQRSLRWDARQMNMKNAAMG